MAFYTQQYVVATVPVSPYKRYKTEPIITTAKAGLTPADAAAASVVQDHQDTAACWLGAGAPQGYRSQSPQVQPQQVTWAGPQHFGPATHDPPHLPSSPGAAAAAATSPWPSPAGRKRALATAQVPDPCSTLAPEHPAPHLTWSPHQACHRSSTDSPSVQPSSPAAATSLAVASLHLGSPSWLQSSRQAPARRSLHTTSDKGEPHSYPHLTTPSSSSAPRQHRAPTAGLDPQQQRVSTFDVSGLSTNQALQVFSSIASKLQPAARPSITKIPDSYVAAPTSVHSGLFSRSLQLDQETIRTAFREARDKAAGAGLLQQQGLDIGQDLTGKQASFLSITSGKQQQLGLVRGIQRGAFGTVLEYASSSAGSCSAGDGSREAGADSSSAGCSSALPVTAALKIACILSMDHLDPEYVAPHPEVMSKACWHMDDAVLAREVVGLLGAPGSQHLLQALDFGVLLEGGAPVVALPLATCSVADELEAEQQLPLPAVLQHFADLATGLAEMEAREMIHLDIKPQNMLLFKGKELQRLLRRQHGQAAAAAPGHEQRQLQHQQQDGMTPRLLFGDFGTARAMPKSYESVVTRTGTRGFIAPEVPHWGGHYGCACDMWSAGCMLLVLAKGRGGVLPFEHPSGEHAQVRKLLDRGRSEFAGVPAPVKELVKLMLAPEPVDRPRAWQLQAALVEALQEVLV